MKNSSISALNISDCHMDAAAYTDGHMGGATEDIVTEQKITYFFKQPRKIKNEVVEIFIL
jgi:hypothetical protein